MPLEAAFIRTRLGDTLSEEQLAALLDSYAALARGIATYPAETLHTLEPALRSTPAPRPAPPPP